MPQQCVVTLLTMSKACDSLMLKLIKSYSNFYALISTYKVLKTSTVSHAYDKAIAYITYSLLTTI